MFLANISLTYEARNLLKEGDLREEVIAKFGEAFVGYSGERILDEAEAQWLTDRGLTFEVRRLKGMTGPAHFSERVQHVTQIAVPNVGLLAIDEVRLLEDACTDMLQGYLTEGWRLIAVCPPNSQRRPDYILGRTQPIT